MNFCFPIGVYAAVCKHLGHSLDFPGDEIAWQNPVAHSSAMLNGYLEEWAVLTEKAENQKFNACDSSGYTQESFWPRLAAWYGIEWKGPQKEGFMEVEYGLDPPPRGYGPKGKMSFRFTLMDWAKRPEVAQAWKEIAAQNGLVYKELTDIDRIFGFTNWLLLRESPSLLSMDKSRKLGWHGFVDSTECTLEVLNDFAKLKMLPPVPMVDVKFL